MGWYRNFSKKMFMALASSGRYQLACECEHYQHWLPGEYTTDTVVRYPNPSTNKISLYRATGLFVDKHRTDSNDVPGESIHWELICSCDEIGFTPTPTPLATPTSVSTPSPIGSTPSPTPTETPRFICEDYEVWDSSKITEAGYSQYQYLDRVQWDGRVWEARDYEGAEGDDIPGISNHWELVFTCGPCSRGYANEYTTDGLGGSHESIGGITVEFFDAGGTIYHNNIHISNQDGISVFVSGVWKNEISGAPFGVILVTGTFAEGEDTFTYQAPTGECWEGLINSHGEDIIITERNK